MLCEKCGKDHDGSFGSGRFCSRRCSNSRVITQEIKEKISNTLSQHKKKFCSCGLALSYTNKSGFCKNCKPPAKSMVEVVSLWRKKKKKTLVEYKGGKCEICGYNKCISALEFHHKNPSEKDFSISGKNIKSLERYFEEVDKCILVCSNCHREIHENLVNLSLLKT